MSVKGLKGRLTEHQHKLYQLLDEGKHLLVSVCCPSLENQLALLGEHWLNNTSKINNELQRLEAILKHWTRSGWLYLQSSHNEETSEHQRSVPFFQISEGVCRAKPVAAICSGTS